jgi:hypothetical protein
VAGPHILGGAHGARPAAADVAGQPAASVADTALRRPLQLVVGMRSRCKRDSGGVSDSQAGYRCSGEVVVNVARSGLVASVVDGRSGMYSRYVCAFAAIFSRFSS